MCTNIIDSSKTKYIKSFMKKNMRFLLSWGNLDLNYSKLGQSPWSMAVGTIGERLKLVPFLLGYEQLILTGGGGGLAVF